MHIIHVDDHKLFRAGLKHCLLPNFPDMVLNTFSNNESALHYINICLRINYTIDLIITDYNHPGDNGLILAKQIKTLGEDYHIKLPVMFFTMRDDDELQKATVTGLADVYFTKDAECEKIVSFIQSISPLTPR